MRWGLVGRLCHEELRYFLQDPLGLPIRTSTERASLAIASLSQGCDLECDYLLPQVLPPGGAASAAHPEVKRMELATSETVN